MKLEDMTKCPACGESDFYESGPHKVDREVMEMDDIVIGAFGRKVTYTICKHCKNIQFWFKKA